jgi:hypothetical protein
MFEKEKHLEEVLQMLEKQVEDAGQEEPDSAAESQTELQLDFQDLASIAESQEKLVNGLDACIIAETQEEQLPDFVDAGRVEEHQEEHFPADLEADKIPKIREDQPLFVDSGSVVSGPVAKSQKVPLLDVLDQGSLDISPDSFDVQAHANEEDAALIRYSSVYNGNFLLISFPDLSALEIREALKADIKGVSSAQGVSFPLRYFDALESEANFARFKLETILPEFSELYDEIMDAQWDHLTLADTKSYSWYLNVAALGWLYNVMAIDSDTACELFETAVKCAGGEASSAVILNVVESVAAEIKGGGSIGFDKTLKSCMGKYVHLTLERSQSLNSEGVYSASEAQVCRINEMLV